MIGHNMFPLRLLKSLIPISSVLIMVGCGSGRSHSSAAQSDGRGSALFTIRWPSRSRLIPLASNSIRVTLTQGATQVGSRITPRPQSGQTTATVEFADISAGQVTVIASAYPSLDGKGTSQALGSLTIMVQKYATTTVAISMASTIATVQIAPTSPTPPVGNDITLTAFCPRLHRRTCSHSAIQMDMDKRHSKRSNC